MFDFSSFSSARISTSDREDHGYVTLDLEYELNDVEGKIGDELRVLHFSKKVAVHNDIGTGENHFEIADLLKEIFDICK